MHLTIPLFIYIRMENDQTYFTAITFFVTNIIKMYLTWVEN